MEIFFFFYIKRTCIVVATFIRFEIVPFVFQKGVIKAVKNSLGGLGEVTALWVTHRLEELKYADGAIYMEDGRVVMHGDVSTIAHFLNEKQIGYADHINS